MGRRPAAKVIKPERWGALFGFLGVGAGAVGACAGVLSGSPSGSEAGFALALIGIGAGVLAAMVGSPPIAFCGRSQRPFEIALTAAGRFALLRARLGSF